MKFVKVVEDGITKVILDLEAVTIPAFKLESRDTVYVFKGTHDFDFTIVNEFLNTQSESTLAYIARTFIDMRRCIVNYGHDDPAADECVGELSMIMHDLFDKDLGLIRFPKSPTGNLFCDLYYFSTRYITPDKVNYYAKHDRKMFVTASLLSALCITIIHTFETHFTDVDDPIQILYPVFEEVIKNSGVTGAKEFVEKCRSLVSALDNEDAESWVIEGIYINECMLHKHNSRLPIDLYVLENYTNRVLSSKSYLASKRIREMKEINEVEEQQRMKNSKISVTPLTNDELKEFNTEAENNCLLPIRNGLKDALDAILLTVKHFYRNYPSDVGHPDFSTDALTDSITTAISTAMHHVDEMADNELVKIAEHSNYVQDAFELVKMYIPDGMLSRGYQPLVRGMNSPQDGYLRKVYDILCILFIPAMEYKGSDIGYHTATYLKNILAEYPGGKNITIPTPGTSGYAVYTNKPAAFTSYSFTYQTVMSTLRLWADENLDDNAKDKFFAFLMRHDADIFKYTQLQRPQNPVADFDYKSMCTFFYRWFLKEQAS